MKLIGSWSNPLSIKSHGDLIEQAARQSEGRCDYCGFLNALTDVNPTGGLRACVRDARLPVELRNLVCLCGFCVNLNNLDNLRGKGVFVELPLFKQSQLINILRIIYCTQSSTNPTIKDSTVYQGSTAVLRELTRIPEEWGEFEFDGSVEHIINAERTSRGYSEAIKNRQNYIDRLRFLFRPEPFLVDIQNWLPSIEAQVANAE